MRRNSVRKYQEQYGDRLALLHFPPVAQRHACLLRTAALTWRRPWPGVRDVVGISFRQPLNFHALRAIRFERESDRRSFRCRGTHGPASGFVAAQPQSVGLQRVVVASPGYVEKHGQPLMPGAANSWLPVSISGRRRRRAVRPAANTPPSATRSAVAGSAT